MYALDLRGRGKSDGERFYVEKFAAYGHFHDLLNDLDKGVVMADIKAWINARLPVAL